jgi:D-alanyl-D-alanine dipeptidase
MTNAVLVTSTRLDRISAVLSEAGIDLLLATPSADLLYLAGYAGHSSERPTVFAVSPGQKPVMVLPELEAPRLRGRSDIEIRSYGDGDDPYECMRSFVRDQVAPLTIAVSDQAWASVLLNLQSLFPAARYVPASPLLRQLRMQKSEDELELLHEAGRRADRAFEGIVQLRFSDRTEQQVSDELDRLLREAGLGRADWGPIVASGPDSASPHHVTGNREIREGDAVVLDFGGVLEGYQADITRTVHVGSPETEFVDVYELVLKAQQAGFEASVVGQTAGSVDRAARGVIEQAGFGQNFIHRTGHGLGLDTHEEPYLVGGNDLPLSPGMTFSVEPGVYLLGRFGVRIEDTVAVCDDGPRRFNHATRELQIVS